MAQRPDFDGVVTRLRSASISQMSRLCSLLTPRSVPFASGSRPENVTPETVLAVICASLPVGIENLNRLWMPDSDRVPYSVSRPASSRVVVSSACGIQPAGAYVAVDANLHYFSVRRSVLVIRARAHEHEPRVVRQPAAQIDIDEPVTSGDVAIRAGSQVDDVKRRRSRARRACGRQIGELTPVGRRAEIRPRRRNRGERSAPLPAPKRYRRIVRWPFSSSAKYSSWSDGCQTNVCWTHSVGNVE